MRHLRKIKVNSVTKNCFGIFIFTDINNHFVPCLTSYAPYGTMQFSTTSIVIHSASAFDSQNAITYFGWTDFCWPHRMWFQRCFKFDANCNKLVIIIQCNKFDQKEKKPNLKLLWNEFGERSWMEISWQIWMGKMQILLWKSKIKTIKIVTNIVASLIVPYYKQMNERKMHAA